MSKKIEKLTNDLINMLLEDLAEQREPDTFLGMFGVAAKENGDLETIRIQYKDEENDVERMARLTEKLRKLVKGDEKYLAAATIAEIEAAVPKSKKKNDLQLAFLLHVENAIPDAIDIIAPFSETKDGIETYEPEINESDIEIYLHKL